MKKHPRGALSLLIVSVFSLFLLSLPIVSNSLAKVIEPSKNLNFSDIKLDISTKTNKVVIVVLSAGRNSHAVEYGNIDTVNAETLQRISYASWLQKKLNLPVLLSGGKNVSQATSDAVLMNQAMIASFSVIPKWIESESNNFAENAQNISILLNKQNITHIILVTHANQITRATYIFEKQGLNVISAPIAFSFLEPQKSSLSHYLPNVTALKNSVVALTEIITLLWYQIRY